MLTIRFLLVCVLTFAFTLSASGQKRQSRTVHGTIDEAISLLEKQNDRFFIRNYVVTKSTNRIADLVAAESVKSFRDVNGETLKCESLSSAESLLKALKEAKSLKPVFPSKRDLKKYNFSKADQKLAWAAIKFDSPVCVGGPLVIWFVRIGAFWYIRG